MRYDEESSELDLRMEADELTIERVSECLHYCEKQCRWPVNRITIRHVQKRSLMRDGALARDGSIPVQRVPTRVELAAVFGVPIFEREDGLTPRERSVQRALADLPPTRAEQVERFLADEAKRQKPARDLKPDDWPGPPALTADDIPF